MLFVRTTGGAGSLDAIEKLLPVNFDTIIEGTIWVRYGCTRSLESVYSLRRAMSQTQERLQKIPYDKMNENEQDHIIDVVLDIVTRRLPSDVWCVCGKAHVCIAAWLFE